MIDQLMFKIKLQVVKSLVQPGDTLDVGCGDKKLTVHLPDPIGIDNYKKCSHIHADPDIWMDARDLEFPANSFDTVAFFDVLEHIPEADVAIKEAWRVLRPNGILAITDPSDFLLFWARIICLRPAHTFRGTRFEKRKKGDSPGHVHKFNKGKLVKLVSPFFKLEKVMWRGVFTGYRFRRVEGGS